MDRPPLAPLALFAAVAERRSFRLAARELDLSPSAVSRAISQLEAELGVRLLARTTRAVALTDEGIALFARLAPALAEIGEAVAAARESRAAVTGRLRVTVPRAALEPLILPKLASFAHAYPEVVLEIIGDDGLVDIVSEGYDAGLRFDERLEPDMIVVAVGPAHSAAVVGSPSYFARCPAPRTPDDLALHNCIGRRFPSGSLYRWQFEKDGRELAVPVSGNLVLNDDRTMLGAAADGVGLAYLFVSQVEEELASGRLVRVLADWCPPFPGFNLYYPSRRQMRPALRAFIDHLKA